ncbi:hypothetical protein [Streptomyces sp. SID8385]|uniref:hypothetical protein n=1 Tax=Streptomyces sp. SID8385 TaxID=2690364 RepID=UPI001361AF63|nr:hypothetical protein [Streptomyces sp. SID8385]
MALVAGCSGGGEVEPAPSPSASSASPLVAPSPTEEVHIESPQERVDAGAEAEGWTMPDPDYELASDYVDAVCETLDGVEEDADPDFPPSAWLTRSNSPEGDERLALRAGVPVLCPRWERTVLEVLGGKAEQLLLGGSYEVSTGLGARSVRPGTYRTTGGEDGLTDCYWERSTDGGDIIDNQFVSGDAKAITVTIAPTDGSFTTRDCGVWRQVK